MKSSPLSLSKTVVLSILLATPSITSHSAPDKQPPTVVVAKTEAQGIGHWQPAMGEGLAQMIITELNKLENVKVLESVALDDLRSERNLGENGEVSAKEAVKKGQWKGADYTFKSVVTRFGSKESSYGGGGAPIPRSGIIGGIAGGFSVKKSENEVQIDWRVIDNAKPIDFSSEKADPERLHRWLESLDPDDLGKYKM